MSAVVSGKDNIEPDVEAQMVQHQVAQGPCKTSTRKNLSFKTFTAKGKGTLKRTYVSTNSLSENSKRKQPVSAKMSKSPYPVNTCDMD